MQKPESAREKRRVPLAYESSDFLHTAEARLLRVLSEYVEPLARFRRENIQDTVVFFGSARVYSAAEAERQLLALEKLSLIHI